MTKEFAGLLAQVVPVFALAIGLELRSLSNRLKSIRSEYEDEHEEWAKQFSRRFGEMKAALAVARTSGRWRRAEMWAHYRGFRDLRALGPDSEVGQSGMLMLLILVLVVGQAYFSGVEFYALSVTSGQPYRPLMSVLSFDLMAQLRAVIDVAFLAPGVEAAYTAAVFVRPVCGERGRRVSTVVLALGCVLAVRFVFGFLF